MKSIILSIKESEKHSASIEYDKYKPNTLSLDDFNTKSHLADDLTYIDVANFMYTFITLQSGDKRAFIAAGISKAVEKLKFLFVEIFSTPGHSKLATFEGNKIIVEYQNGYYNIIHINGRISGPIDIHDIYYWFVSVSKKLHNSLEITRGYCDRGWIKHEDL